MPETFALTLATVWYRGHPFPVSTYPSGPAATAWYVLLEDGQWHHVRERRGDEAPGSRWAAVESDVVRWLEQRTPNTPTAPLPPVPHAASAAEAVTTAAPVVAPLVFESGAEAFDFVRRLSVLFDSRTSRLIIPSMPVVIYGPALIDSEHSVTLYAGRGVMALARYLGIPFPRPGSDVDVVSLADVGVIFGAPPKTPRSPEPAA